MTSVKPLVAVALAVLLAAGCSSPTAPSSASGSPASPGSSALAPSADELAGTWKLQSMTVAGGADQAAPSDAQYTLTFTNGRLSTREDCNLCSGGFNLSGQTLTAGPALACTRAFCPTQTFGSAYERLLSGESTVTLSDGALVLTSARGVLRFTR